ERGGDAGEREAELHGARGAPRAVEYRAGRARAGHHAGRELPERKRKLEQLGAGEEADGERRADQPGDQAPARRALAHEGEEQESDGADVEEGSERLGGEGGGGGVAERRGQRQRLAKVAAAEELHGGVELRKEPQTRHDERGIGRQ